MLGRSPRFWGDMDPQHALRGDASSEDTAFRVPRGFPFVAEAIALACVGLVVLFAIMVVAGRTNYLAYHSIVEFLIASVGLTIFFISWHTRQLVDDDFLTVLGIAQLFVAGVTVLHILGYNGMAVFNPADPRSGMGSQFWLVIRGVQAAGFIAASAFIGRRLKRPALAFVAFGFPVTVAVYTIFAGIFPVTNVAGAGLTPFKINTEVVIVAGMGLGLWMLWRRREHLEPHVRTDLMVAVALSIVAEMLFMVYKSPYDVLSIVGHIIYLGSMYFIYRALVARALEDPFSVLFRTLAQRASRIAALKEIADAGGSSVSRSETARRQAQTLESRLGAKAVSLFAPGEKPDELVPLSVRGYRADIVARHFGPVSTEGAGVIPLAFRTKRPSYVRDVDTLAGHAAALPASSGLRSEVVLPLLAGGEAVGTLSLGWSERHHFDEDERSFLDSVASEVALGLQSAKLLEAERDARLQTTRELRRTTLLRKVAFAATTSTSLDEVALRILGAMAEDMGLTVGTIYSYDASHQSLNLLAAHGLEELFADTIRKIAISEESPTLVSRAVLDRRIVSSEDVPMTEERRKLLRDAGLDATVSVAIPVEAGGDVIGTLSFVFEREQGFSPEELSVFHSLAAIVGQAMQNARLFEEVQNRESRFRVLFDTMSEGFSINEIILDEAGKPYDLRYLDVNPAFERHTGLKAADLLGKTLLELFPDTESEWFERYGAVALTGVSDHWDAQFGPLGRWFEVSSYRIGPGRFAVVFFDTTERRSRLEAMQENQRLSDALNVANKAVHSSLEIDKVMHRALETGVQALGCDAGVLEMLEGDEWVVRQQVGSADRGVGTRLSASDAPIAARAARERAPFVIDATGEDGLDADLTPSRALKSVLAVPLVVRTVIIGCALFYTTETVKRFSEAEIDFGRKLGSVVSLGLDNARLYEAQHRIAETLQQALLSLPKRVPGIEFAPFYESATESTLVGGDFYDIFELDDDRVGITIGDISGKGLKAAVLTSLVRNTIRAHANESGKTPAEIVSLTNSVVHKSTPVEAFATVFFGILDRRDGELTYVNAGHTTGAILRRNGSIVRMPGNSPIVGGFPEVEMCESTERLEPNDLLFLYTDGLTEARREDEWYHEERLFDLLPSLGHVPAQVTVAEVMADVIAFAENRLRDDLAILAVRRLDHPGTPRDPVKSR